MLTKYYTKFIIFLAAICVGFTILADNQLKSQEDYYINLSTPVKFLYYKDVQILPSGTLYVNGLYDNVLGNFLFSVNSKNVYKVAFDEYDQIVNYYRQSRMYTPKYNVKGGIITELYITVENSNVNQLRIYEYEGSVISKQTIYVVSTASDGISILHSKDQEVIYNYNNDYTLITSEIYNNYNQDRNVNRRILKKTYERTTLVRTDIYGTEENLLYYLVYNEKGDYKHYKPSGELVKEYYATEDGEYTIDYYPAILREVNGNNVIDVNKRYGKGVTTKYKKQNDTIIGFTKSLPEKNGFTLHDFVIVRTAETDNIVESIKYIKEGTWEECDTIIQVPYEILPGDISDPKSRARITELDFRWIDKEGNDLSQKIPKTVKDVLFTHQSVLIGAEYVLYANIVEPQGLGNYSTIAEIYNDNNERDWCNLINGYLIYIGKLSENKNLSFNTLVIKSKGYNDYYKEFTIEENEKIINIGQISLKKD